MKSLDRLHDEKGLIAAITMVLVALLFFGGTVMALAVQSNLHTISQIRNQDAIHYAAESAVARGVADSIRSPRNGVCGYNQQVVNGQPISSTCYRLDGVVASPGSAKEWAAPAQAIGNDGATVNMDLGSLGKTVSVWTVIGWRSIDTAAKLRIRLDGGGDKLQCRANGRAMLSATYTYTSPGPAYFSCSLKGSTVSLRLAGEGGRVGAGSFVIRGIRSEADSRDVIVTVIGCAGRVNAVVPCTGSATKEADVLLPHGREPVLGFWGTVLP